MPAGSRPGFRQPFIQLVVLATSVWAVCYGRALVSPLQEAMSLDLALSDNRMALLQGPAVAIPIALGSIPLGLMLDRYVRARLCTILILLNLIACILTA